MMRGSWSVSLASWRGERGEGRGGKVEEGREGEGSTNLEEVLHSLWIIAVALSTDPLHLLHLTGLACRLRGDGDRQ